MGTYDKIQDDLGRNYMQKITYNNPKVLRKNGIIYTENEFVIV